MVSDGNLEIFHVRCILKVIWKIRRYVENVFDVVALERFQVFTVRCIAQKQAGYYFSWSI